MSLDFISKLPSEFRKAMEDSRQQGSAAIIRDKEVVEQVKGMNYCQNYPNPSDIKNNNSCWKVFEGMCRIGKVYKVKYYEIPINGEDLHPGEMLITTRGIMVYSSNGNPVHPG